MSGNEILEDLFFIERGYLNCNHFVYKSAAPILIDTGYIGDFSETESLIKGLGVDVSDVALIISTHTHCDHIGGNKIIQQKSDCGIALHKVGKHFMDTQDDWGTWWRYYDQEAEFFKCTHSLEDGDILTVGPHEFEVMYTPGHAADGIVLYNRKEKILISSDTLWENDVSVMTLRVEGSTALFHRLESLNRLEALEVEMVYPGHGKPFSDMSKALSNSREKVERYFYDRELIGNDLVKKLLVYTLLTKRTVRENDFFPYLMNTHWFKENIDLYFNGEYEEKYYEIINSFLKRGIVKRENGSLYATIKA
ncbi:MAG: MBL fold metallo-hydrolase [Candidatus Competibacter sp.]|nr:MBL fold metallo-hydrolase [Candidatus Competibacter sp.]MDG4605253.1 MBL fold metallo-hydrolase [Candidatus Contendobacter sp.]HRD50504.1 MBL fold metallo-hydrolase [Candidatus Contendobacter sp.]